jgi:hypothetical protein
MRWRYNQAMAMRNTDTDFYGRQEDEKILYVVRPHVLATIFSLLKVFFIALTIGLVLVILGTQVGIFGKFFIFAGIVLFLLICLAGAKIILNWQAREIAYITDRRIIRFEPTTLFATNFRTLTWDEVVKVKTYPPNFLWKQLAIGSVVVHARTPVKLEGSGSGDIMADDIELKDVYYYRDLGNYIDKILFTYKQRPKDIDLIRPFVPKPKGQRD